MNDASHEVEGDSDDVAELLETRRELTEEEQGRLQAVGHCGLEAAIEAGRRAAARAYSVAPAADFAVCVREHLDRVQRAELAASDMFSCPVCGRLLKDRDRARS